MKKKDKRGTLLVLSGPSGAGKSTVIHALMERRGNLYFSVSYTTRQPREGEQEGVNYHYISNETFEHMVENDEFLEHAGYVDHYYGTGKRLIEDHLSAGEDVILDIEVQGAAIIREKCPDAVLCFLTPPSFEELARRLRGRQSESEEVVLGRLARAKEEYQLIKNYDYLVVNDQPENAVAELAAILDAASCRVSQRLNYIEGVNLE
jgi:guanylate kinase